MKPVIPAFEDMAPTSAEITEYDRQHIKLYMRLLDAAADGADWSEAVEVLFGLDAVRDPVRARRVHDSHLARARPLGQGSCHRLSF